MNPPIHKIRFYLSKPLLHANIKRFMFQFKFSFSKGTQLLPKSRGPYYDFIRNPSFIAQGSFVYGEDLRDLSRLSYAYLDFLKKLTDQMSADGQLLLFIDKYWAVNLKMFQHFFDALHSRDAIDLNILRATYPKIVIDSITEKLNVSNACVITTSVAHKIQTQSPLFLTGKLRVLDFGGENAKKNLITQEAYKQTGQPHPDLLYAYKKNGVILWSRYYDIKSGNYDVNKGHLIPTSDKQHYEFLSEKILNSLIQCYFKYPNIILYLKNLRNDKTLTWSDRNEQVQIYFRDHLHLYPDINPSFVIYIPLEYNLAEQKTLRSPVDFLSKDCFINIDTSKTTAARILVFKGSSAVAQFKTLPGHDPKVLEIAQRLLDALLEI